MSLVACAGQRGAGLHAVLVTAFPLAARAGRGRSRNNSRRSGGAGQGLDPHLEGVGVAPLRRVLDELACWCGKMTAGTGQHTCEHAWVGFRAVERSVALGGPAEGWRPQAAQARRTVSLPRGGKASAVCWAGQPQPAGCTQPPRAPGCRSPLLPLLGSSTRVGKVLRPNLSAAKSRSTSACGGGAGGGGSSMCVSSRIRPAG